MEGVVVIKHVLLFSVVVGGTCNFNSSCRGFIGAGFGNCISSYGESGIVSGFCNSIVITGLGGQSFIGGGNNNCVGGCQNSYSSIVGGYRNTSSLACFSFIGGGCQNCITGTLSSIAGGTIKHSISSM